MAINSAADMKDALQNGSRHFCPVCRSPELVIDHLNAISPLHAEQDAGCRKCSSTWTLSFAFSEILNLDTDDKRMGPDQLREKYATSDGGWGQHGTYPLEDWQHEVGNDETRLGYWEWVAHQLSVEFEG